VEAGGEKEETVTESVIDKVCAPNSAEGKEANADEAEKQKHIEDLYLKLIRRRGRPTLPTEEKEKQEPEAMKSDHESSDENPPSEDVDDLLAFVKNLPDTEESGGKAEELLHELETLKAKVDKKYEAANPYVDPELKRPEVRPEDEATGALGLQTLEKPAEQRIYYDVAEIETASQRILRAVKER